MPKPKRRRRTAAEIRDILTDLGASELSRPKFASSRHISLSTLQSWVRKYGPSAPSSFPDVIPVGALPAPVAPIEIEFPSGEILRLCPGWRDEDLRRVLVDLRRC